MEPISATLRLAFLAGGIAWFVAKRTGSDADQLNRRVVDDYHSGNWQPDPDEQARVQAYFAELDRRRSAAND